MITLDIRVPDSGCRRLGRSGTSGGFRWIPVVVVVTGWLLVVIAGSGWTRRSLVVLVVSGGRCRMLYIFVVVSGGIRH